jgi:hypothetical protein
VHSNLQSVIYWFLIFVLITVNCQAGGKDYAVPCGRWDGCVSSKEAADAGLPGPDSSVESAAALFSARGLNKTDMVTLLGEIKILIPMLLAKSSNMRNELNVKSGHLKMGTRTRILLKIWLGVGGFA